MFPSSGGFVGLGHAAPRGRVVLCVHDQSAFLPVQLAEVFLTRSFAVEARRIDFSMAVPLEDVEYGGAGGKGVHAGLLGAWLAECHGAEDDVEGWGFGARHFGLNLVFRFWDWVLIVCEMCGLSAWITTIFLEWPENNDRYVRIEGSIRALV
jgi:hypothetical protein